MFELIFELKRPSSWECGWHVPDAVDSPIRPRARSLGTRLAPVLSLGADLSLFVFPSEAELDPVPEDPQSSILVGSGWRGRPGMDRA